MRQEIEEIKRDAEIVQSGAKRDRMIGRLHRTKDEFAKEDLIEGIIYAFEEAEDREDFTRAVIMELKAYGWDTRQKLYEWQKRL